ncbi:MAG: Gfo/Idh/MocA family oxidoreductase [Candidatus Omnitrophica bacterium]|nr:Inositol 2-dehydrogenase/D-chiro-inositol 3-dehydrogenase [bacterium]NUN97511.1 Gfo/Idh/MocA family oxidoreductase [Candidatus Omnitrophota bacterium]
MRFGLIGVGMIADFHRRAIQNVEGAEVVGVTDKFPEAARKFGEQHGIPVFESIEKLVKEGGAEIVTIGTPSGFHLEPTLEAAKAGAHVLSEKPMEITTERIDRMTAACREAGVKLGGILQFRTFDGPKKAKQVLSEGKLGRILIADAYIKYYRTQDYYNSAAWRGTWALDGGGATMNQGVHWVDCIQWLVGEPEWVQGLASTLDHQIEVEDACHAIVRWKSGGQGVIEATTCAKPGFETRIEIHGEKGSILLEDTRIKRLVIDDEEEVVEQVAEKGGGYGDPKAISTAGHEYHIRDMIEAVKNNRDPVVTGAEARKSVRLITAIYESSRGGKRVHF